MTEVDALLTRLAAELEEARNDDPPSPRSSTDSVSGLVDPPSA
jgi:hypothetical protein